MDIWNQREGDMGERFLKNLIMWIAHAIHYMRQLLFDGATALKGSAERDLIGIFEVATNGKSRS